MPHLAHGLDALAETEEDDEPSQAETQQQRPAHRAQHVQARADVKRFTAAQQIRETENYR